MNERRDPRLEDRVAIVTGAGSGIGEAAARTFAREGARVVLVGRREAPLRSNAEVIARAGGEAIVVAADVSSSGDVERIVADTLDRFGRIDCVFNNGLCRDPCGTDLIMPPPAPTMDCAASA